MNIFKFCSIVSCFCFASILHGASYHTPEEQQVIDTIKANGYDGTDITNLTLYYNVNQSTGEIYENVDGIVPPNKEELLSTSSYANRNIKKVFYYNYTYITYPPEGYYARDYSNTDFSNFNWQQNRMDFINFNDTNFSGTTINTCEHDYSFFRNSKFSNSTIIDSTFFNSDFSNADFSNSKISNSKFEWGIFTNTNFTGASIHGSNQDKSNPDGMTVSLLCNTTGTGITRLQLESTQSFQEKMLNGVGMYSFDDIKTMDFSGINFDGFNLKNSKWDHSNFSDSDFSNTDLLGASLRYCNLTNTRFENANIHGNEAPDTGIILSNVNNGIGMSIDAFLSTNSYNIKNLNGITLYDSYLNCIDFSDCNMRGVKFFSVYLDGSSVRNANLSNYAYFEECGNINNVDFSGATIHGSGSYRDGIYVLGLSETHFLTRSQLESTNSFSLKTLSGVCFAPNDLYSIDIYMDYKNIDLSNFNLTHSTWLCVDFTRANLQNADLYVCDFNYCIANNIDIRGALRTDWFSYGSSKCNNLISVDGKIKNFSMNSSDDNMLIRKYIPPTSTGTMITAKFEDNATINGNATLTLEAGAIAEILSGVAVVFGGESTLIINLDKNNDTSFVVNENANLVFEDGATIVFNVDSLLEGETISFSAIEWDSSATVSGLNLLKKGSTLMLLVNGKEFDTDWTFTIRDNKLWIMSVPEPATYAAIFGALALAFAAYRRRK